MSTRNVLLAGESARAQKGQTPQRKDRGGGGIKGGFGGRSVTRRGGGGGGGGRGGGRGGGGGEFHLIYQQACNRHKGNNDFPKTIW